MKTTIDKAGRVVIPKRIREAAKLQPGTELEVRLVEGVLELEPVSGSVELRKQGHFLVASPLDKRPSLTPAEVRTTLDEVRRERGSSPPGRKSGKA